MIMQRETKH